MQATVWGGAGEHGRSCYLIEQGQTRVLLDCGVKKEGAGEYPLCDESIVPGLNAVFLSHAHEDHSMAIPLLYKMGYTGQVWTTRTTFEQLPAYFTAWKKYVASQDAELPYDDSHISAVQYVFIEEQAAAGEWCAVAPGLSVCWGRSGHLAGSIWLLLNVEGSMVFYSGDFTAESTLLAADWPLLETVSQSHGQPQSRLQAKLEPLKQPVALAIIDSAYGMDTDNQQHKLEQLQLRIQETLQRKGPVLLPVPTYGRGQEMLLWARDVFPGFPIFVEQEIAEGLEQLLQAPDWLQTDAVERIKSFLNDPQIVVVTTEAQREQAAAEAGSRIVFTNDGMLQSARGQWYYERLSQHAEFCMILTGHLAKGSFAHQLLRASCEPAERLGNAAKQVHFIRYKVHQGLPDVRTMLDTISSEQTILVHTGKPATDAVCAQLGLEGYTHLHSLTAGYMLSF
jgi:Cft2 family RNA processing exonuclease